jgi:uncharacterized protein
LEVGVELTWETLRDTYKLLFPRQKASVLTFGGVFKEIDVERNNEYILSGTVNAENHAYGLFVTRPEWNPGVIADALARGFRGIKPYPDLAPTDSLEISIYDFLPHSHLAALNERSGILMLHLPRKGRIADPDNIRELLEITEAYPSIKVIVAHIGRAFCLPTAQQGLPFFRDCSRIYFDTSANLNSDVFEYALETIGPDRILFGSDLPITLMRGVREHVGDNYINYTDAPYSWNVNRKSPEEEASYTYFLYEELRAIIDAVKRTGLGVETMEKILCSNSAKILDVGDL